MKWKFFTSKIKLQIKQGDQQQISGATKFIKRYKQLSAYWSTAWLASAFHQFRWVFVGATFRMNFKGNIRYMKRITVQATSAERRRGGSSRGKAKTPSEDHVVCHSFPKTQYVML